jgi:phage terminase large subunit-like protein
MSFLDYLSNSETYTERYYKDIAPLSEATYRHKQFIHPPFYINKLSHSISPENQKWIRNAADERAVVEYGCTFSEEHGQYVVNWIEANCVLYEGEQAGSPMNVEDWQYEMYMQTFGWLWFDEDWERRKAGSGWLRRYKVISGWVPKKNAKSPTLASTGLYMFAGDGELGQKCFSLATTRDQALISHTHALNFVRQSPTLSSHCKIDATTGTIFDRNSNSFYSILCGDKGGLKKSKEGINGSLFIDETHVVDRSFIGVVRRAGISRRQPIHLQLSTAGKDTAGYGYEQFTIGEENIKAAEEGRPFDFRFFHFAYAIPQKTSVDELRDETRIEPLIRMANPTIGRIISYNEVKQDWVTSCRSDTELIEFAMYRLNQWNTGGGSFIAGSDWERCAQPFRIADIKDYPCVIGCDLSKVSDMTSVVLIFAVPKTVQVPVNYVDLSEGLEEREINVPHIIPFFWVPRRSLSQYTGKLNVVALEQAKQLYITDSPVIKMEVIAEHINYLDTKFDVRGLATDMYRSKALSATLSAVHNWDVDNRVFLIPQTNQTLEPAIEQLQGCILSKEIVHNNNTVMNWQLGNIVVHEDTHYNRRFQKPGKHDFRKIDGWASLLNGFCLMMNDPDLYPGLTLGLSLIK